MQHTSWRLMLSRIAWISFLITIGAPAWAATVTWIGFAGNANTGGSWEASGPTPWSNTTKPQAADNALLGNVTAGARTVTVDAVETINQLSLTQTTVGPTNTLTLNQNLTVSGNASPVVTTTGGGATAPVINVTGGKVLTLYNGVAMSPSLGTLNLGASSQFLTTMGAGTDWNNSASPTFGAISMAAGSLISLSQQAANSAKTFNGAVNVAGTGVSISSTGTWQIGDAESMTFNAPVALAAGANLTVNETKQTYNGGSGQPGITLGADAQMTLNNNRNGSPGVVVVNGMTMLGDGTTTKLTVNSGVPYAPTFTGTTDLGSNATLALVLTAGTDWANTITPTFGAVNLAAGSLVSITQPAANSAKTFNGAVNATGAGARISSLYTWQIGSENMNFNAPVSVTGSGSSLTITERNAATFNGSAGNNALTVGASAAFVGGPTGGTYTFTRPVVVGTGGTVTIGATTASAKSVLNGLTLAAGIGTTFTLATNQSPCAPTFGGTTDLGANSKLILQQLQTTDWNTTLTPTFGVLNMGAGAQLLINGSQANSVKTFNGAVGVTGAGAVISSTYQQWVGTESMVFNAPIAVTGAGSSLTVNELGSMSFLGGSGQPGVTLGAGATFLANQTANDVKTFTLAGASLAADPATTLTLKSGREFTANITGTLNLGAGAKVTLQNTLASSDGNGRSIIPTFSAVNLGAGSQLLITSLDNLGTKTFNGPIGVTGAGATVTMAFTRWTGANVNVNAPLSVTGAGSTLVWTDQGDSSKIWAFNGGSGQPGITVGAGAQMTVLNQNPYGSDQMKITGLTLGADPNTTLTLKGAGSIGSAAAPTILDGAVSLGAGSKLVLDFGGTAGDAMLSFPATATVVQDGAAINWNWSASGNGGGNRNFANAGTWTLQNGAQVGFTTPNGRPAWVLQNNANSDTMRILSGSSVMSCVLTNSRTLELGTSTLGNNNVYTPVPEVSYSSPVTMVRNSSSTATINVTGDAFFGNSAYGGSDAFLLNGTSTIAGGQLLVGNGSNGAVLTVQSRDVFVQNAKANTAAVAAGSTLKLLSDPSGDPHNFYGHAATLTNAGDFSLAGKIVLRANAGADVSINNGAVLNAITAPGGSTAVTFTNANAGIFTVAGAAATVELAAGGRSYQANAAFRNYPFATLQGSGSLTFVNSSGDAARNSLSVTNNGTIAPGVGSGGAFLTSVGGLTLANAAATFNAGALTIDIGGVYANPAKFDALNLNGTGGSLTLTAGSNVLNILPVNGFTPTGTYRILNYVTRTGTFDTLQYNGGSAAGIYSLTYTATGIDAVFAVSPPTWTSAVAGTWGTGANWTGGMPNGVDAQARFGGSGSNGSVTLDAPQTAGHVVFDNAGTNYTLGASGSGSLTLQVGALTDVADITVASGAQAIAAPVAMASNSGVATVGAGSSLALSGGLSGGFALTKSGPGTLQITGASYTGNTFNNAGTLDFNEPANRTYAGTISGAGAVVKSGAGALSFSAGANAVGGGVSVTGGKFVYNGAVTGNVAVSGGATFGGVSTISGKLSGPGLFSPGASPGIITAAQVDAGTNPNFAFEFTVKSSPAYSMPGASLNDVLRLTGATPFTAALTGASEIDVYFGVSGFQLTDPVIKGGFYTDMAADFAGSLSGATWKYFLADSAGSTTFNGTKYLPLGPQFTANWSTVAESADFGAGIVNGRVLQFQVIPEPTSLVLLGLAGLALARRRRA